jgi:hypothetical protein
MARFKPVRGKGKSPAPSQGAPCLIIVVSGILLLMVLLYQVLKHAS